MNPRTTVCASLAALGILIVTPALTSPARAQEGSTSPDALNAAARRKQVETSAGDDVPDDTPTLSAQANMPESDGDGVDEACRAAARRSNPDRPGTIVACAHGPGTGDQRVESSADLAGSTDTGALHPPDVSGMPGCLGPCITIPFGKVPEPVYYIDLAAIPEAPEGSDAWKIGQGRQREP